jgi:hypothetical protein
MDRNDRRHRGHGLDAGLQVVHLHVLHAVHQAGRGRVGPETMAEPTVQAFDGRFDQESIGMGLAGKSGLRMIVGVAVDRLANRRQGSPADPAAAALALRQLVTVCPMQRLFDIEKALRRCTARQD